MNFRLGCAIWAYKDWVGELFPAGSRSSDFLRLYSRRFMAVEGNTTFYSVPKPEMVDRWVAETPPEFEFCLKLPRDITHRGRLAPAIPEAIAFLEQMQRLGSRLGPLLVQLPPSYSPEYFDDLVTFLKAFSSCETLVSVEVRHPDWFRDPHASRLNAILTKLGVGRVLLDSRPVYDCPDDPQLQSERRKPRLPLQPCVTASISLVRYISHPNPAMNQPYFQAWVEQIRQWLDQGTRIYFFVHCPVEVHSPVNARLFQHCLEQCQVPVPPLPWDAIATQSQPQSTQLSLF
jgi:uncharacterized protein YecE (DUF72 family)